MDKSVMLDTSFFLRFLNEEDFLFQNAKDYYQYAIKNNFSMVISTISIAEYCVKGNIDELPMRNLKVLPFNIEHSIRTGEFARILFEGRNKEQIELKERKIIPNDSKLFAQADTNENIEYFFTSDVESLKAIEFLKIKTIINFSAIDIRIKLSDSILSEKQQSLFKTD
jgi:hypothetical protein